MIQDVKEAMASARLVTVVGPGGVGKTRLAIRVARDLARNFRDGVWLVELAGLTDPELIPTTMMAAIGLRDQSKAVPLDKLLGFLKDKRLLMVVDNCEHLLERCAAVVDSVLRDAGGVHLLATSRERFRLSGEHVIALDPLALPDREEVSKPGRAAHVEAIALLVERANQAGAALSLDERNVEMVTELCRRLDGMPLAIELAAACLRTLSAKELVDRMSNRFDLLTGGARDAEPRQQSLRAAIDWSHDMLADSERVLLRRLAVFAGGFDLPAVEAVVVGTGLPSDGVVEALSGLIEKSFVTHDPASGRYGMHETMRQYALARLQEANEEDAQFRAAHAAHYLDLCQRADKDWFSPRLLEWHRRIEDDVDNIRATLQFSLDDASHLDQGLDLAGALWLYWMTRALGEGRHWLDALLARRGGDRARAWALHARGCVALHEPDLDGSARCFEESAYLARECGDVRTLCYALGNGALPLALAGQTSAARELIQELAGLASAFHDDVSQVQVAGAEELVASLEGDMTAAAPAHKEAEAISRKHGDIFLLSYNQLNMAWGYLAQQRYAVAMPYIQEGLRLKRQLDDRPGIVAGLEALAIHADGARDWNRAARLLGAADAVHRSEGTIPQPFLDPLLAGVRERAVYALGEARYATALTGGSALDRLEAIRYGLGEVPGPEPKPASRRAATPLGSREEDVAMLVAEEMSNKEIAARLFLSERTVESHVSSILNKLGVNSRRQIAAWVASRLA